MILSASAPFGCIIKLTAVATKKQPLSLHLHQKACWLVEAKTSQGSKYYIKA
jgi:hypothetical protein